MEMDHFSHEHPLTLIECEGEIGEENTKIRCYGCKKFCTTGLIYACTKCCFYLHRSCAELPQEFQNPFHPHPLTLHLDSSTRRNATSAPFWECYSCSKDLDECFFFQCKVCKFNLHVDCALFIPTKEEGHNQLEHVTHFHPLNLIEIREEITEKRCKGCEKLCTIDPIYACTKCCFYLHKSCAKLPQKFQNPFHPHPFTLHLDSFSATFGRFMKCYSCSKDIEGFFFQCKVCKFNLHVDCALLIPTNEEGHKQLLHVTHLHPLTLDDITDDITKEECLVCGKHCLDPCYGCKPCGRVLLHQPCAEFQFSQEIHNFTHQPFAEFQFPQEIHTYIHPCPLALQTQVNHFQCVVCSSLINGMAYFCERCNFWTDVECALSTQGQEQFKHYSHGHPLALIDKIDDSDWHCFACDETCSLGPTYVCNKCKFFLHQSCAWFPAEIQDSLHPLHPLTLLVRPATLFRGKSTQVKIPCNLCANDSIGIIYKCDLCDFNLHGKCIGSGVVPTVEYEDHGHLLCLVEKIDPEIKCNACYTCCDSWVLRCIKCNFNLHVPCGPLPYTIEHECDIHPLTLKESPVEKGLSDDEFYCDVCEEQRDPRLPFYYSADCGLVAEIACVFSEVAKWLKGEYGDVNLRTSAGRIAGKASSKSLVAQETGLEEAKVKSVFTLDHIFNSLTEDENVELNDILKTREIDIINVGKKLILDKQEKSGFSFFSFFFGKQDSRPEHSKTQPKPRPEHYKTFLKNEEEVSNVRDYMMKTISVGKKLFDEQDSLDIPLLSEVAYREFMQKLEFRPEHAITFWKNEEEVVSVKDYMVTRKLAPVLEGLCATYGDVSIVEYKQLTSSVKTVLLVILCGTIDSMCNTKVVNISEDLILNWWNYLKLLQSAGFKIQFAFDHLKRIVHAYLGVRLKEQEDKTLVQLDDDIKMYSKAIEEFTKITEGLKLKRKQIASEQSTRKSSLIVECLKEGSKSKWRNAGEGLLQLNKFG